MSFFGGLINRIAGMFRRTPKTAPVIQQSSQQQTSFGVTHNLVEVQKTIEDQLIIYLSKTLSDDKLRLIGQFGVETIREYLKPLKRTGALESSWYYNIDPSNMSVTITSKLPQASTIQSGIYGWTPPRKKIATWIRTKSDFGALSDKEIDRLAFLIQRSIKLKKNTGQTSTLFRMPPTGERRYKYLDEASSRIASYAEKIIST